MTNALDFSNHVTEKIESCHQGHNRQHNDGTLTFSGALVRLASGVVKWNCWMKQQSSLHTQGDL